MVPLTFPIRFLELEMLLNMCEVGELGDLYLWSDQSMEGSIQEIEIYYTDLRHTPVACEL